MLRVELRCRQLAIKAGRRGQTQNRVNQLALEWEKSVEQNGSRISIIP
jgi:hypothetical protein